MQRLSKAERVDYMKRLLRIESAKAEERMNAGKPSENSHRGDEETAKHFGISSNTMRREMTIADNKELLTPSDFADWDEERLIDYLPRSPEFQKNFHAIPGENGNKEGIRGDCFIW